MSGHGLVQGSSPLQSHTRPPYSVFDVMLNPLPDCDGGELLRMTPRVSKALAGPKLLDQLLQLRGPSQNVLE